MMLLALNGACGADGCEVPVIVAVAVSAGTALEVVVAGDAGNSHHAT